jgi:O-antigen/teichoic acid export membrane protein
MSVENAKLAKDAKKDSLSGLGGLSVPERKQRLGVGTVQVLLAECLVFPLGLITAAYVGRALGPRDYGIFAVALATGDVIEWTMISLFSRATVQVVSEAVDWRAVAAAAFRLQTAIGVALGVSFFLTADLVARALGEPSIGWPLRVLALELPLLAAGIVTRNVLTGRGKYRERALSSALRLFARMVFVIVLVAAGFSIRGAIVGEVLSTVVWLAVVSLLARIPTTTPGPPDGNRRLWSLARPLFMLSLSLRVLDKVGVVALKMLGASAREAGWYAAAQNFGIAPGVFAVSFAPLLLSALATAVRGGNLEQGRPLVRNALRLVFGILPFVAFGAGAAPEVIHLIYGNGYEPAARLAIPLLGSAMGMAIVSVAGAILAAADEARRIVRLVWPVTVAALVALALVVPRYGAMGAAVVIGVASLTGAGILLETVRQVWGVGLPIGTFVRTVVVSAVTLFAGLAWPAYGGWIVVKTLVFVGGIVGALAVAGEFSKEDVQLAKGLL